MNLCERIRLQLTDLFACEQRRYGMLLRTPLARPDGDLIELVLKEQVEGLLITDLGETARWFDTMNLPLPKHDKIEELLDSHCATFIDGEIQTYLTEPAQAALGVLRVAQACLDFTAAAAARRTQTGRNFTGEVLGQLSVLRVSHRAKALHGRSGERYRMTETGDVHSGHRLVECLSSRQNRYAMDLAHIAHSKWQDLRHLKQDPESGYKDYITVLDDAQRGLWTTSSIRLLEQASTVVLWSEAGDLRRAFNLGASA